MGSRKMEDLLPEVATRAKKALALCKELGYDVIVTCTYRSPEEQELEFKKGASKARAWQSYHQYRLALDIVVRLRGEFVWNPKTKEEVDLWNKVGKIFMGHGFEWAKYWKSFPELAHFQITGGKTWQQLKKEKGV